MPDVRGRVEGLLERAQHQRRQRGATAARALDVLRPRPAPIAPTSSPRRLRRDVLGNRRRRDRRGSRAARPGTRSLPARAARGRGTGAACAGALSSCATCSLARIISSSITLCDSVCTSSIARTTCPSESNSNSGSEVSSPSAPRFSAALAERRSRACGRCASGSATGSGAGARPANTCVDLLVGEPGDRSGSGCDRRRPCDTWPSASTAISTVTVLRGMPGHQAAGIARERLRQHRLDRARHVDAVAAPQRLLVDRASPARRAPRRRRCGRRG